MQWLPSAKGFLVDIIRQSLSHAASTLYNAKTKNKVLPTTLEKIKNCMELYFGTTGRHATFKISVGRRLW